MMRMNLFLAGVLALCLLAEPSCASYLSVLDYGTVGNGIVDDTTAIKTAIADAAAQRKTLQFPRGDYRVTAPLTISGQLIMGLDSGGWPADALPMPKFIVAHSQGPALTMKAASSIHGLAFTYNRAQNPNPQACILLDGNGLSVVNVRIQYCHDGIMSNPPTNVGRTNIENVFIVQPSGTGVYMTNTLDVPTLRNIEVWCNGPMQPGPGFRFGRNDGLRMSNCFVLNTQVGMLFEDDALYAARGERAGTYGVISNTFTDACSVGVRVTGYANLDFTGGHYWNHHDCFNLNSPEAVVRLQGCELQSNGAPALNIQQAKSLIVSGCRFVRALVNDQLFTCRFEKTQSLTLSQSQFGAWGPCIDLRNGLGQAIITDNIFEPSSHEKIRHSLTDKPELLIRDNLGLPAQESSMMSR